MKVRLYVSGRAAEVREWFWDMQLCMSEGVRRGPRSASLKTEVQSARILKDSAKARGLRASIRKR